MFNAWASSDEEAVRRTEGETDFAQIRHRWRIGASPLKGEPKKRTTVPMQNVFVGNAVLGVPRNVGDDIPYSFRTLFSARLFC